MTHQDDLTSAIFNIHKGLLTPEERLLMLFIAFHVGDDAFLWLKSIQDSASRMAIDAEAVFKALTGKGFIFWSQADNGFRLNIEQILVCSTQEDRDSGKSKNKTLACAN